MGSIIQNATTSHYYWLGASPRCMSLDKAVIDLGRNVFAHGQAYVALSRMRNLEGVMLTRLQRSKLNLIDNAVHEEYARLALRPISS